MPLLLWTLPVAALDAQYNYTTNNGSLTITRYTGSNGGSVAIPAVISDLPVTAIGPQAFAFSTSITNISMPDSVTSVGAAAFTDCTGLTGVTIGNHVKSIGDNAFFNCSALASVTIPDSVTNIGAQAFYSCVGLTSVDLPSNLGSIGKEAFSFCTKLTSVTIPSSVAAIGDFAFDSCKNLTVITVDEQNLAYSSLAGVLFNKAQTALIQCPGAKVGTFAVPNGVTSIASSAFRNCYNLTTVTIPNSVTNIGDSSFSLCSSLTTITVDALNPFYSSAAGVLFNKAKTILIQCPAATPGSFSIPNTVVSLGSSAFIGCKNLTAINADPASPSFSSLAGVLFDKQQKTLVQFPAAISGSYTLPDGVTRIGGFSFVSCAGLTNITLASTVQDIGLAAFAGCVNLASMVIPDSVTNIGTEAFEGCTKLASVAVGKGVSSIGTYAFYQCSSLKTLTLPDSLSTISDRAFQACTALTNVTIGSGVSKIGTLAFGFCPSLTGVFCRGNAPTADPAAFANDSAGLYYLAGTTGWGSSSGGLPTGLWNPQALTQDASFGMQANQFGFNFTAPTNLVVVVEACTSLANPVWTPVQTNSLSTGTAFFVDGQAANSPARFYRIRTR